MQIFISIFRKLLSSLTGGSGLVTSLQLGLNPSLPHLDETRDGRDSDIAHHNTGGRLSKGLNGSLELGVILHGGGSLPPWEDNEVGDVSLEPVDINGLGLLGLVSAPLVDGNSDGLGVGSGDSGGLELSKGESLTEAHLSVVTLGGAVDGRTELVKGGGGNGSGLGGALHPAGLLLSSLVEVDLDSKRSTTRVSPLLVEVSVGNDVVVLDHFFLRNIQGGGNMG